MNIKTKNRRGFALFRRTSPMIVCMLATLACSNAHMQSSATPTTPTTPTANGNRDSYINYDRPSSKIPETTPNGAAVPPKVPSKLMGRDMPYRVILPKDYENKAEVRYPVIYLLHGLAGHFNDWADRTDLVKIAEKYSFIIITPEGNDGWYSDSPAAPNDKYESYIIDELIPEIDKRFRTLADRQHRVMAGLSMGGYGSLKFGLKFPDRFSIIGSFSGALGVAEWSEKAGGNKLIGKSIDKVFGPINSDARRINDVFRLVRELTPDQSKNLPYIYLSCGTEDSLMIKGNREFDKILTEKNIMHEYRTGSGGHDWVFWGSQMREFFDVCNRRIKN